MCRPYPEKVHKLKAASIKIKNELNGLHPDYTRYIQAEYMSTETEQAFLREAVGAMDAAAEATKMEEATKFMEEAIKALDLIRMHNWSTDIEKWNRQSDVRHKIVERLFKVPLAKRLVHSHSWCQADMATARRHGAAATAPIDKENTRHLLNLIRNNRRTGFHLVPSQPCATPCATLRGMLYPAWHATPCVLKNTLYELLFGSFSIFRLRIFTRKCGSNGTKISCVARARCQTHPTT